MTPTRKCQECILKLKKYGIIIDLTKDISQVTKKVKKLLSKYHPDKGGKREIFEMLFDCYKIFSDGCLRDLKIKSKKCKENQYQSKLSGRCFNKISSSKDEYKLKDYCKTQRSSNYACRIIKEYNLIPNHYFVLKKLGQGSYGITYLLCNKRTKKCDKVIKVGKPKVTYSKEDFQDEIYYGKKFHKLKLAPTIYKSKWLKKENTYYIIMDRIDTTLYSYLKKKRTNEELNHIFTEIYKLLITLKKKKLLHGDFHTENIGLVQTKSGIKVVPFDFGFSYYNPTTQMVRKGIYEIELLQLYFVSKYIDRNPNKKYVINSIEKILENQLSKEKFKSWTKMSENKMNTLRNYYYKLYL